METILSRGSIERLAGSFFGCILIMLVPVIVKSTLLPSANFTVLTAGAFVAQLCWYYGLVVARNTIAISAVAIIILLNACLAILINCLSGRDVNEYDFINLSVKTLSLILFVDSVSERKITRNQLAQYARYMMYLSIGACIYNLFLNSSSIASALASGVSAYAVNFKSFFLNRNQFGMALVVWFVMTDYAYAETKSKAKTLVHLFQIANIVLTLSRGAILATTVYFLARRLLFIQDKNKFWRLIAVFASAALLAIAVIYTPQLNRFVMSKLLRIDVGGAGRVYVWLTGLNVFLRNPVNGVGTYTGLDIAIAQGFEFDQFHNSFLDILVSGGIVELFATLFIIMRVYKRCAKNLKGTEYISIYKSSMLALLCTGSIESVSFFSMGYVDTMFTVNYLTLPMLMSNMNLSDFDRSSLRSLRDSMALGKGKPDESIHADTGGYTYTSIENE